MVAAAQVYTFSGHETFPFRYPWLKKGVDAVRDDPGVFNRDDAITILGVGKNMVRSIRHWCLTARLIEEDRADRNAGLHATKLGKKLLGDSGLDPYLEDPATLWLLHWQIATNQWRAATWFWTFSHFHEPEFSRETLTSSLLKWTQTLPGKQVAAVSVQRDVEVFLRTYVPSRRTRAALVEDALDCPLTELDLIQQSADGRTYYVHRVALEQLPPAILLYATLRFWEDFAPASQTLSLYDVARQPGSPGRVFKLDESALVERFEQIEAATAGTILFTDTAGLKQLARRAALDPFEMLAEAYKVRV